VKRSSAGAAVIFATAACLCFASLAACGARPTGAPGESVALEPRWQDVFDTMPELFIVVRPRSLRQDKVYGPLLTRAVEAARQQSRVAAATRALDAVEDADEVIAGARAGEPDRPGELVVVARGVRADLDPGKLVDADGRILWAPGPNGRVRELVCERDVRGGEAASLFELPGRTWVIASDEARERARSVFAHPLSRPKFDLDGEALAIVRIDGPSLVKRVRPLQGTGGLAAVGRRLQSVTLVLPPGSDRAVRATLSYADEDAAAFAEVSVRAAIAAVARTNHEGVAWLGALGAAVAQRADKRVVITAPLPPRLIDELLRAGSAPLEELHP
jgi:hypothetical protein